MRFVASSTSRILIVVVLAILCCTGVHADFLVSHGLTPDHYTASASWPTSLPPKAFDGDHLTQWNAGGGALNWIEVDLGGVLRVNRFRLEIGQSGGLNTTSHEVWVSTTPIQNDRSAATLVRTFVQPTTDHSVLEATLDQPVYARYVQVYTLLIPSWLAWFEVEVYALNEHTNPVVDDGLYTPVTDQLHALWNADPQFTEYRYAIGTSPTELIVDWKSSGTAVDITETGLSMQQGRTYYWYVEGRLQTGEWTDYGVSDGITIDATPPTTPIVTDDGVTGYGGALSEMHADWNAQDAESHIVEYRYAIGTSRTDLILEWKSAGTATQATETLASLGGGRTYYWYVQARNGSGLWSDVGSSDGITLYGQKITVKSGNAPVGQLDPLVTVSGAVTARQASVCGRETTAWSVPIPETDWISPVLPAWSSPGGDFVYEVSFDLPAGYVSPGIVVSYCADDHGTGLVLNGHPWGGTANMQSPTTYTTNDAGLFIAGINVLGLLVSNEGSYSGLDFLAEVTYALPLTPTVTDGGVFTAVTDSLHATWDVDDPLNEVAEFQYAVADRNHFIVDWTSTGTGTEATETGLSLETGVTYYWYVRSRSCAGQWSDIGASDGITVDTTPPVQVAVTDDGQVTGFTNTLHASWTASDPGSGIAGYLYGIGTSPVQLAVGWKSAGAATQITETGLSLQDGQTYYWYVKAINGSGLESDVAASNGILIDATPPTTPVVLDDGDYTTITTSFHARWSAADVQSGIVEYQYAIGRSPSQLVVNWRSAGTATEETASPITLLSDKRYFCYVKAKNGGGAWSEIGASDGIIIDTTAPNMMSVTDDGIYTTVRSSAHAAWVGADAGSGIAEYRYAFGMSPNRLVVDWKSAGAATEATETGLSLQYGATYRWYVKARNNMGMWSTVLLSDGITIARPATIGEARKLYAGSAVLLTDAVVTSSASDSAGLWIESRDRSSGIRVTGIWPTARGDNLHLAGIVNTSGEIPTLETPELKAQTGGPALDPIGLNQSALGNDRQETLSYFGLNSVGLLVTTWGKVTRVDTVPHVLYVDDGAHLADGMGPSYDPFIGIRVHYASPVIPPSPGRYVRVTGIRSVERVVLPNDAFVNGVYRIAGEVLYLPTVLLRDQSDILLQNP